MPSANPARTKCHVYCCGMMDDPADCHSMTPATARLVEHDCAKRSLQGMGLRGVFSPSSLLLPYLLTAAADGSAASGVECCASASSSLLDKAAHGLQVSQFGVLPAC